MCKQLLRNKDRTNQFPLVIKRCHNQNSLLWTRLSCCFLLCDSRLTFMIRPTLHRLLTSLSGTHSDCRCVHWCFYRVDRYTCIVYLRNSANNVIRSEHNTTLSTNFTNCCSIVYLVSMNDGDCLKAHQSQNNNQRSPQAEYFVNRHDQVLLPLDVSKHNNSCINCLTLGYDYLWH